MHLFRSIGVAFRTWVSVLRLVLRPKLWLPFLCIAALHFAFLLALVQFHRQWVTPFAPPIIELAAGERATHYPFLYFFLPQIYAWMSLVSTILLECVAVGAATVLFARAFGANVEGLPLLRLWPRLILATAVPMLIVFGMARVSGLVPAETLLNSRVVRWGVRGGYLVALTLIQSLVAYASAWIVLRGLGPLAALRDSMRVTARTFLPTWIVIGVPVALIYPLHHIVQRTDLFVNKLSPEAVAGFMAARFVCEIGLGFLVVGAVTRLFLWRIEAAK